ncbi:MAG: hypothetical protein HUU50_01955 [Candidatus Brocadiae bacterium]|nr:hypothetical protein [Candidatus Brocadiia bacterium]
MNNSKLKIEKNFWEIVFLFFISFLYIILGIVFWGRQGHIIVDCGRELYIPSAMLNGYVLYKDIFNIYGPLSYQINALLYIFFGENLNTLLFAGFCNGFLIIITLYLISKTVTSAINCFGFIFLVICSCIYSTWICNYIFPYSYSIVYSLSSFLLSVLFLVYYVKYSKSEFAILSCFFIGISIATKYEYYLYCVFLIFFLIFFKPLKIKNFCLAFLAMIFLPSISVSILFLQGLKLQDCIDTWSLIQKLFYSSMTQSFYTEMTGLFFDKEIFFANLQRFWQFWSNASLTLFIIYFFLWLMKRKELFNFNISLNIKIALSILFFFIFPFNLINNVSHEFLFSWLPLSALCILLFLLGQSFWKAKYKLGNLKRLLIDQKIFILLSIISLLSALKALFFLNLRVYGTFTFPLVFLVNFVFICEYIPNNIKRLDKRVWQISWLIFFLFVGSAFSMKYFQNSYEKNISAFQSEKGTIYGDEDIVSPMSSAYKYLKEKSIKNFLVIPEGVILNFFTNIPSHNKYYYLIPQCVEIFGEEKVVQDLEQWLPDYIILNNRDLSEYGYSYIGKDFALKIFKFITENYTIEKKFTKGYFILYIAKKKGS